MSFDRIPVIDLEDALKPEKKQQFLRNLQDALVNVGFFLLVNFEQFGPSTAQLEDIKSEALKFFALPDEIKQECGMLNSPHFLGYTKLGDEITGGKADWREQIDLGTELPAPENPEPLYKQLEGPNLWPRPEYAPNFRPVVTDYIKTMTELSTAFRSLICEAIGLPAGRLDSYFKPNQQCKIKLISYPEKANKEPQNLKEGKPEDAQGVGPHRDSDFITFIFQASEHTGSLQVQNFQGKWVPIDNVPGSLVVAVGQTLEAITDGVCKATIHKVTSPQEGAGVRLSIPFFQTIDIDSRKSAVSDLASDVLRLRDERDKSIDNWGVDVGFQFKPDLVKHPVGHAVFWNRIKSHQDVAARWYPNELKQVLAET
ncbi:LAFA_0D01376g1_1 [Lachancea sp. 'fantastica']|nr:LAFA_0D01376g1_1 [Lachancea sp. 'fantastica']